MITPYGSLVPLDDGSPALDWHIAADDRWHSPAVERNVRQRRMDGTAVVETRVRVPKGDVVQQIYSVADHGGLTVIDITNDSPLPIAIAFTRGDLLSVRPPVAPISGIALPAASVAFPIGHRATLTVAIPHRASSAGELPRGLPDAAAVARGWRRIADRGGRLLTPDDELNERVVALRCEIALGALAGSDDDAVAFLLAADQLTRMGELADTFVVSLAHAVELVARASTADWSATAALFAADRVLASAGEHRARHDLAAVVRRLQTSDSLPATAPDEPARALAWVERRMVAPHAAGVALLPAGLPDTWAGHNFEVFALGARGSGTVSFVVRWHGDRPAVLWEQTPDENGPARLTSPQLASTWHTDAVSGEALWDKYNSVNSAH